MYIKLLLLNVKCVVNVSNLSGFVLLVVFAVAVLRLSYFAHFFMRKVVVRINYFFFILFFLIISLSKLL